MSKIPVGETILHGYGFAIRRPLANLGLTWLAAVFYAVAVCYWLQNFATTMLVSPRPGSELNDFALFDLFCLVVATAFGSAVIGAALTREALQPSGETKTAYLAVAKREWFLFFGSMVFYALLICSLLAIAFLGRIIVSIGAAAMGAHAQWHGIAALPTMNAAVAFVAFAVTALLVTRVGFLLAPVSVAETPALFPRAWTLSRGNFWRILLVSAALLLPAVFLWAAVEWLLTGQQLAAVRHDGTAFYQLVFDSAPIAAAAWAVLVVIVNMVFAGATAFAYEVAGDETSPIVHYPVEAVLAVDQGIAASFANYSPRYAKAPAEDAPIEPYHEPAFVIPEHEPETIAPVAPQEAEHVTTIEDAVHSDTQIEPVAPHATETLPENVAESTEVAVDLPQAPSEAMEPVESPTEAAPIIEHADASETETHSEIEAQPESEPVVSADPSPVDFIAVPQFPRPGDGPAQAVATEEFPPADVTPPPSHDDVTESSPQSAPSEAA